MKIVSEDQIQKVLDPGIAFSAVEGVFQSMESTAWNFPVIREALHYQDALYGFKSGFDPQSRALGLKAGGYWPNNEARGIPNHQSSIFLFDSDTGECKAMLGGNTITALRTAAASAVSIHHLAVESPGTLGLIGSGFQSYFQLEAALRIRKFDTVLAWNRSGRNMSRHKKIAGSYGVAFKEVALESVVRESLVLITITSCFSALFPAKWIRQGCHIAAMGTDTTGKKELANELINSAERFTDEIAQSRTIGEFQYLSEGHSIRTLGSVIQGNDPGRTNSNDITIFDGTGVGLQDLACAQAVVKTLEKS